MSKKKYETRYRQVGDGIWKGSVIGPDGEEAATVMTRSAVKAQSQLLKKFGEQNQDGSGGLIDAGYVSGDDMEEWETIKKRWKRRYDELREMQESDEKIFFLRLMGKYGMSPEQLAPVVGLSAPTIRSRMK